VVGVIRNIGDRARCQRIILAFHIEVSRPLDCVDDVLPRMGVVGSLTTLFQREHSHDVVLPALLGTDQDLLGNIF
jgi:hypothetical protein